MYTTPESVIAAGVIIPTLASSAVCLRFYTRVSRNQGIDGDDWATLVGLFLTWALSIVVIVGSVGGALGHRSRFEGGVHAPSPFAMKISLSYGIIEKLALGAIKLSVVLMYRRIFRGPTFDKVTKIACGLIVLWSLTYFVTQILVCGVNIHYMWSSVGAADFKSHCFDNQKWGVSFGVTDAVSDILILCIPIPMVWKLQMPTKKRLGVILIFLLGSFSVAAGIGKMAIQIHLTYFQDADTRDLLSTLTDLLIWSLVEAGVAVIASCLPTIQQLIFNFSTDELFRKLRSRLSRSSMRSSRSKSLGSDRSSPNRSPIPTPREHWERAAAEKHNASLNSYPENSSGISDGQESVRSQLSKVENAV